MTCHRHRLLLDSAHDVMPLALCPRSPIPWYHTLCLWTITQSHSIYSPLTHFWCHDSYDLFPYYRAPPLVYKDCLCSSYCSPAYPTWCTDSIVTLCVQQCNILPLLSSLWSKSHIRFAQLVFSKPCLSTFANALASHWAGLRQWQPIPTSPKPGYRFGWTVLPIALMRSNGTRVLLIALAHSNGTRM